MKRTRAEALVLVNWRGVFYSRYELDPHVTALEGSNGAGKTTVMIAAYIVLLPDMSRLRFTNLGETGATGGDKGVWGRLGELGRPSYAAMEFALPKKERWVAGVHLERRSEPSVEPTPFIVTGLGPEVRLQDLFLIRRGDEELVPELQELRENAARLGAQLKVFNSARDYFAMLFEHGVTPLRLGSDEEKNKLNEMLKTSMTGGLSRALTSELRDFVLKEEGGLEDTLRQMRGQLDTCRRTRTEVRESRQLLGEIGGVFLAGHMMFTAAYLATRERADEHLRRVADAEAAERIAYDGQEQARAALRRVLDALEALQQRRVELLDTLAETGAKRDRMAAALDALAELERLGETLAELTERREASRRRREEAEASRGRAKAEVQMARLAFERAAAGMADHQRGLEELHRRAGAYHQVTRRLREAGAALGGDVVRADELEQPEQLETALVRVRAELERVDVERREKKTRLADADAHRVRHGRAMAALLALDPKGPGDTPHEDALEALRRYREAQSLAERLPEIERGVEETKRLATRQEKVRQRALNLGLEPAGGSAELVRAHDEAEASKRRHEAAEREARAELAAAQERMAVLEAERRVLMVRDELWPRLEDIARRLDVTDRDGLDRARRLLSESQTTLRRREDQARAERDRLQTEARALLAVSGPYPPELLALRDKLEGEVVASLFEESSADEAAHWEARLGGLARAILVDDPKVAARRLGDRPDVLDEVVLLPRGVDLSALVEPIRGLGNDRELVVQEGAATRVSRIPSRPRLGRRARQARAAELETRAAETSQQLVEIRNLQRQAERLLAESETLLIEQAHWLAGNPRSRLGELRSTLAELESSLPVLRANVAHHLDAARALEPRVASLRGLLGEALLLDPPDHGARLLELEDEQRRARDAKRRVMALSNEARLLESELGVLRSPPLEVEEREALAAELGSLTNLRERLDLGAESLAYVVQNREALAWSDAIDQLAAKEALNEALTRQLRQAEQLRQESEGRLSAADETCDEANREQSEAEAEHRVVFVAHRSALNRFEALGIAEPSPHELEALVVALASLEAERAELEPRRDLLLGERGAKERAQEDAEQKLVECQGRLVAERRDAEPALARWERLRTRAEQLGLTRGAIPEALAEVRGTPNLHQVALTNRALLREKLTHARGGEELLPLVELRADTSPQEEGYLELWLAIRDWLRRCLPAQVAEVDDPSEALARFKDQLVGLEEKLERDEAVLRGNSEDIASSIATHIRNAKRQIKSLNKHLGEIAFGGIAAIRIQVLHDERMEAVLAALREGAAQGAMFQSDTPLEDALDELFRRFGGGKAGGQRLLDYRQYLRLQVEVQRKSGTQWEVANPTRLSTGEAIGVGAALMMVVLTEWERYATMLRGKKAHGSLRFLFLDEANRLSQDNLGVLFDLCQTLDLQLLIAAPEVARAEGNTTYRLVRKVTAEGREEVEVSGRRAVS